MRTLDQANKQKPQNKKTNRSILIKKKSVRSNTNLLFVKVFSAVIVKHNVSKSFFLWWIYFHIMIKNNRKPIQNFTHTGFIVIFRSFEQSPYIYPFFKIARPNQKKIKIETLKSPELFMGFDTVSNVHLLFYIRTISIYIYIGCVLSMCLFISHKCNIKDNLLIIRFKWQRF